MGKRTNLEELFRRVFSNRVSTGTKTKMVAFYIKHMNLYTKGTGVASSLRLISIERVVTAIAALKIIMPEVDPWILAIPAVIYYPLRTIMNWAVGLFWEVSDGYSMEAEWAQKRAAPQRVYMLSAEEYNKSVFTKPGENHGDG